LSLELFFLGGLPEIVSFSHSWGYGTIFGVLYLRLVRAIRPKITTTRPKITTTRPKITTTTMEPPNQPIGEAAKAVEDGWQVLRSRLFQYSVSNEAHQ
jgi:hypothetical protein